MILGQGTKIVHAPWPSQKKGKKELVSIAAYRKCYSAHGSNMEVEIRFTPLHADAGAGFGEAPEVPSKGSAKGGRKPSSKTFDEGWD